MSFPKTLTELDQELKEKGIYLTIERFTIDYDYLNTGFSAHTVIECISHSFKTETKEDHYNRAMKGILEK